MLLFSIVKRLAPLKNGFKKAWTDIVQLKQANPWRKRGMAYQKAYNLHVVGCWNSVLA